MAERDRGVGMKNVLIIGATGTLGSAVRQKLLKESNHHLTLFARSADQLDPNPQEQIIAGNVMNDADLDSAVKNQDAIFVALSGPLCRKDYRSDETPKSSPFNFHYFNGNL